MSHPAIEVPPPPSSDDDDERPAAKRVKVFRACAQCVSAKTRCEDVKAKGCWLCRRKRKDCSLAGAITTASSPQHYSQRTQARAYSPRGNGGDWSRRSSAHPPQPSGFAASSEDLMLRAGDMGNRRAGTEMIEGSGPGITTLSHAEARISASELRISALERELHDLRTLLPSGPQPSHSGDWNDTRRSPRTNSLIPSYAYHLPVGRSSRIVHLAQYAQLQDFSETIFSFSTPDVFPSVISAGLLQQVDVDLAFHSFKHHFSSILPLGPFLSIRTPAPTHNFVVLAFLHHVPSCPSDKLVGLVDQSIITALSGHTDIDVVLAFLILSLAPAVPCRSGEAGRPSPLRMISLAYQLGRDLGLDARVQGYLARGDDLSEPFWAEAMEIVQLWTAVINRYILLHLMHGHGRPLPTSPAPLIPHCPDSNVQRTTNHLMDEYRLAQCALEAMQPLMAVEAGQHEFEDVKRSMLQFQAAMERLSRWKRDGGSPLLDLDHGCLEYIAVSRLSFLFQRIPSPLQPIRQTLIAGMSIFVPTAKRFLETAFPDNTPSAAASYSPHFLRPTGSHSGSSNPQSPFDLPQTQTRAPNPRAPAHVYMCANLALLAIRGTAAHMRYAMEIDKFPNLNSVLGLDRVVRAEHYLRSLGGQMEAALNQADEAFGTVEELISWSAQQSQQGSGSAQHFNGDAGANTGGIMNPGGGGGPYWDNGVNSLLGSGLFDFDLFSWDPSLLTPDWIPGVGSGPQGPGFGHQHVAGQGHGPMMGSETGMERGMGGSSAETYLNRELINESPSELRQDWKNALR